MEGNNFQSVLLLCSSQSACAEHNSKLKWSLPAHVAYLSVRFLPIHMSIQTPRKCHYHICHHYHLWLRVPGTHHHLRINISYGPGSQVAPGGGAGEDTHMIVATSPVQKMGEDQEEPQRGTQWVLLRVPRATHKDRTPPGSVFLTIVRWSQQSLAVSMQSAHSLQSCSLRYIIGCQAV